MPTIKRLRWLLTLLPLCLTTEIQAQQWADTLALRLRPITKKADIRSGQCHVTLARDIDGETAIMRCKADGTALQGTLLRRMTAEGVAGLSEYLWQYDTTDQTTFTCFSPTTGQYVSVPNPQKPAVALTTAAGKAAQWIPEEQPDGTFVLRNAQQDNRALMCNTWDPNDRFSNYTISTGEPPMVWLQALRPQAVDNNRVAYISTDSECDHSANLFVETAAEGDTLCNFTALLLDKQPLHIERAFRLANAQLSYRRTLIDGQWETLCVPFDADVPDGFEAEEAISFDGQTLTFAPVGTIRANCPVIIRVQQATADTQAGTLCLTALHNTLAETTDKGSLLHCNYDSLSIEDREEAVFLLTADGSVFGKAAAGSTLSPFRAYLLLPADSEAPRVEHLQAAAVSHPTLTAKSAPAYGTDGRQTAPGTPGIHIINHKKIYIRHDHSSRL